MQFLVQKKEVRVNVQEGYGVVGSLDRKSVV